jgi:transposase
VGAPIARQVGCGEQIVRDVVHDFNAHGLGVLRPGSRRAKTVRAAFDAGRAEQLQALLHRSPRTCGRSTSLWALDLAAAISFEQGLIATRVSDETIRMLLKRLGVRWKRAKQ